MGFFSPSQRLAITDIEVGGDYATVVYLGVRSFVCFLVWMGRPGSDDNEGVLRIPESSSNTGTSPTDFLVSYPWHSLVVYLSAEKQSLFYSTSWLGNLESKIKSMNMQQMWFLEFSISPGLSDRNTHRHTYTQSLVSVGGKPKNSIWLCDNKSVNV